MYEDEVRCHVVACAGPGDGNEVGDAKEGDDHQQGLGGLPVLRKIQSLLIMLSYSLVKTAPGACGRDRRRIPRMPRVHHRRGRTKRSEECFKL